MADVEHALDGAFSAVFGDRFAMVKSGAACVGAERQFCRPTLRERRLMSWSKAGSVAIDSNPWRLQVRHKLLDGFGVDDIALWLNCHVSHVRAELARLREAGEFRKWWGGE